MKRGYRAEVTKVFQSNDDVAITTIAFYSRQCVTVPSAVFWAVE